MIMSTDNINKTKQSDDWTEYMLSDKQLENVIKFLDSSNISLKISSVINLLKKEGYASPNHIIREALLKDVLYIDSIADDGEVILGLSKGRYTIKPKAEAIKNIISKKERVVKRDIWVLSKTLNNDLNDKEFQESVKSNLSRGKHYTYFIPDTDIMTDRVNEYFKIFGEWKDNYKFYSFSPDKVLPFDEVVVYDPEDSDSCWGYVQFPFSNMPDLFSFLSKDYLEETVKLLKDLQARECKSYDGRIYHHTPYYEGIFGFPYHMEMISDRERVTQCQRALDYVLKPDMTLCELGCGTGIFSIYAAKRCKKVYAIEVDDSVINIARKNAENNNIIDKIQFLHEDVLKLSSLPDNSKVDAIFCEMMSIWCINEPQVPIMNHARRFLLKKGGVTIPRKIINNVELGNIDYIFHGVELKASLPQFSGIRPPRIMTESKVFNVIDFNSNVPTKVDYSIRLKALVSGRINCARLASIVQFAPSVNFYSTDSLMPITIVPLRREIDVEEGDNIEFYAKFKYRTNLYKSTFEAMKV